MKVHHCGFPGLWASALDLEHNLAIARQPPGGPGIDLLGSMSPPVLMSGGAFRKPYSVPRSDAVSCNECERK